MLPSIAKVILVEESLFGSQRNILQSGFLFIHDGAIGIFVQTKQGVRINLIPDNELVKVAVALAHRHLDHGVKKTEATVSRQTQPAPDGRLNIAQFDFQLVDHGWLRTDGWEGVLTDLSPSDFFILQNLRSHQVVEGIFAQVLRHFSSS